jgi:hypothetical protein
VLRKDGTLWLNLGDSYANDAKWGGESGGKHVIALHGKTSIGRGKRETGLKPKDLCGIPWRVAFALQEDGWWLRQDIIWSKPNPMPESVTDRCTKAHEYMFMLSKSERYYYDAEAIAENSLRAGDFPGGGKKLVITNANDMHNRAGLEAYGQTPVAETRNRRSVWEIATAPFSEAHFATFPPALIEPCILAGCPKECCAKCGTPWVRDSETSYENLRASGSGTGFSYGKDGRASQSRLPLKRKITKTIGWAASCSCNAGTVGGIVLDPFGGAGTTGLVADRLGRNAILIELNPEYAEMARRRIEGDCPLFVSVACDIDVAPHRDRHRLGKLPERTVLTSEPIE